ncbi:hypothetical protein E2C01_090068 [Portunus trituberculatus]|uniref:Uncharacterized protein n=1 Tax=Portunus trituberculatus TaxID=210409 RepID=A0A5B7JJ95_PORTR|nr:hypothetical protein [Portunus trituberculatus]
MTTPITTTYTNKSLPPVSFSAHHMKLAYQESQSPRHRTSVPKLPRPVKTAVTPVWLDIPESNTVT